MVDYNLRMKKYYLASYVIATINEGAVNKSQKCLKPTVAFPTILSQLTMTHCFLHLGQNFLNFNPFVFMRGL